MEWSLSKIETSFKTEYTSLSFDDFSRTCRDHIFINNDSANLQSYSMWYTVLRSMGTEYPRIAESLTSTCFSHADTITLISHAST